MQMKTMITLIIILCVLQSILNAECFTDDVPSNSQQCHNRGETKNTHCCYVKYTTDKHFGEYKTLCIDVLKSDIEDGLFEEVMKTIESGQYTNAGWSRHQLNYFKNYASIKEFDCKSNYLTVSLLLFLFLLL